MTDRSGLLRDWRVVLAGGLAVLAVAVTTLVVRTGDPATADSYLQDVRDAAVVLADGTLVIARDGLRVPDGATVRTGTGGGARLTTAGRDVYLGALTTVLVTDGVHQVLQRGQVMADGRGGPHLALRTRAGTAALPGGSLVRVEMGSVLRIGVFEGAVRLKLIDRSAEWPIPALYQLQVPYSGLPRAATPLALVDDAWEQQLAAELVNADRDLNALARGLTGSSGLTVLLSAPVAARTPDPTTTDRGEQALSVAVAQVSRRDAPLHDTLSFVRTARSEGGSWGVVAALVQARVTAVSALLDTVLAPPGSTPPATVAGATPPPNLLSPSSEPGSGSPTSPGPSRSGPSPTRSPRPRPSSPSPSAPADDLITTVTNLLSPSPTPVPVGTPKATLPPLLHLLF